MKTKMIIAGIVLCVIAACGVTNSPKIDPHSLDGLWAVHHMSPIPCKNGGTDNCGRFYIYWYASVNYPTISLCKKISEYYATFSKDGSRLSESSDSLYIKEDLKVAQVSGNQYKIKKVNGAIVNNDSVTYIITKDSTHYKDGITYKLNFTKIKNEKKTFAILFLRSNRNKEYQKCMEEAVDTTGIFPSTQGRAVKPE